MPNLRDRPLAVAIAALALGACSQDKVGAVEGELRAAPRALTLDTWEGHPVSTGVELTNAGRAPRTVRLEAPAPWALEPEALHLGGGETRVVTVHLPATSPGSFDGVLRATSGASAVEVTLRGEVREIPSCPAPASPCEPVHFDVGLGACTTTRLPDGTACGGDDGCLKDATCQAGRCVGAERSCDDGDPCTLDGCSALAGCVHLDNARACPGSDDPCLAPACDPGAGCTLVPVPDGTACGQNDCTTARVCLGGACQSAPAPEGSVCAVATPCQGEGRCAAGACAQPSPHPLVEDWRLTRPGVLRLSPVADAQGNLPFTTLRDDGTSRLFSATPGGAERFEVELEQEIDVLWVDPARARIYLLLENRYIEARSALSGALIWRRDGVKAYLPHIPGSNETDWAVSRLAGAILPFSGDMALVARRWDQLDPGEPWLVVFSKEDGEVVWVRPEAGRVSGIAADGFDNLYVSLSSTDFATHQVLSTTGAGAERWRVSATDSGLVTLFGGEVYVGRTREVLHPFTGAVVRTLPGILLDPPFRMARGFGYTVREPGDAFPRRTLVAAHGDGTVRWSVKLEDPVSAPVASARGGALVQVQTAIYRLLGVDAEGTPAFFCPLPGEPSRYSPLQRDENLFVVFYGRDAQQRDEYSLRSYQLAGW